MRRLLLITTIVLAARRTMGGSYFKLWKLVWRQPLVPAMLANMHRLLLAALLSAGHASERSSSRGDLRDVTAHPQRSPARRVQQAGVAFTPPQSAVALRFMVAAPQSCSDDDGTSN